MTRVTDEQLHMLNAARAEAGLRPAFRADTESGIAWPSGDERLSFRAWCLVRLRFSRTRAVCFRCWENNGFHGDGLRKCIALADALLFDSHEEVS